MHFIICISCPYKHFKKYLSTFLSQHCGEPAGCMGPQTDCYKDHMQCSFDSKMFKLAESLQNSIIHIIRNIFCHVALSPVNPFRCALITTDTVNTTVKGIICQ